MRLRHLLPVAALALSALTVAPLAHADTPPDVVMLKNGGMLRGTIQEMDPQGNVVIQLADGEKRTFPMTDVKYAGIASGAPGAEPPPAPAPAPAPPAYAPPPVASPPGPPQRAPQPPQGNYGGSQPLVTVHGTEARLQLRGEGLTFHRKAGTGSGSGYANGQSVTIITNVYESMCSAPCDVSMPRGKYTLALSKDGQPIEADPVDIQGDGTLEGTYTSRTGVRIAGIFVVVGGVAGGLALAFSGETGELGTEFYLGNTIMLAGVIAGTLMIMTPDKAEIRFIPGAPVSLTHPSDLRADSGSRPRGFDPGLSLAMTF